jgi:hypothetical protein
MASKAEIEVGLHKYLSDGKSLLFDAIVFVKGTVLRNIVTF